MEGPVTTAAVQLAYLLGGVDHCCSGCNPLTFHGRFAQCPQLYLHQLLFSRADAKICQGAGKISPNWENPSKSSGFCGGYHLFSCVSGIGVLYSGGHANMIKHPSERLRYCMSFYVQSIFLHQAASFCGLRNFGLTIFHNGIQRVQVWKMIILFILDALCLT